ncbi:MAG: hypothetical protein H6837_01905 [Planctomycetes bacterium]|nr:hypothetical protein [Planctomycetota bacterium]
MSALAVVAVPSALSAADVPFRMVQDMPFELELGAGRMPRRWRSGVASAFEFRIA